MKKNKTVPIVIGVVILVLVVAGAVWAKGYYDDRYVGKDYYTMIPLDESMETVTQYSMDGEDVGPGKEYQVMGYDADGNPKKLEWIMMTAKGDLYQPGTYLRVSASSEIVLNETIITKEEVPEKALAKIEEQ